MTELVKFKEDNEQTMSSREIAELTNKKHYNVLQDIDKLDEVYLNLGKLKIQFTSYIDSQNKERREANLTRLQTLDLMTGYSPELRVKVNHRWHELESNKKPLTLKESLKAQIALIEKNEKLELKVDNLQTALDIKLDWISIIKVSQFNNVSENKFNWRVLKSKSKEFGYEIKKASSPRYPYQNLYHVNVFKACYPEYKYNLK